MVAKHKAQNIQLMYFSEIHNSEVLLYLYV